MASAPSALSVGTRALAVAASSAKLTPRTPDGVTIAPVPFSVMPMNPMVTASRPLPKVLRPVAGNSVLPSVPITLAAR